MNFIGRFLRAFKEAGVKGDEGPLTTPGTREQPATPSRNAAYISGCEVVLHEMVVFFGKELTWPLLATVPLKYEDLVAYSQNCEKNQTPFPEAYRTVLQYVRPCEIRAEIEAACVRVVEMLFWLYSDLLSDTIFKSASRASQLQHHHALTQAARAQDSLTGQNALRRNISPLYAHLDSMGRLHSELSDRISQVEVLCMNSGFTWGAVFQNLGMGVMIAANPYVSIPMAISTFFRNKRKEEEEQAFLGQTLRRFCEYMESWNVLQAHFSTAYGAQLEYVEATVKTICCGSAMRILKDLDAHGCSLKGTPAALRTAFEAAKANFEKG